ncbi:hypothetical protein ACFV24_05860 [Nocardia fluminea]
MGVDEPNADMEARFPHATLSPTCKLIGDLIDEHHDEPGIVSVVGALLRE